MIIIILSLHQMSGALCADFTLDGSSAQQLKRQSAAAAHQRRCCRWLLLLLALAVFFGVMIAVSLYITGGRKVFGSM